MRKNLPPNPYRHMRLGQLGNAMSERAGDLMEGRAVGRRDVAYMLIVASNLLRPGTSMPNSPALIVAEGSATPLEAYGELLEREQRSLRAWIFHQAVDAAGGPIAGPDFDAASQRAVLSDADCRASLERILQDPPIVQGRRG